MLYVPRKKPWERQPQPQIAVDHAKYGPFLAYTPNVDLLVRGGVIMTPHGLGTNASVGKGVVNYGVTDTTSVIVEYYAIAPALYSGQTIFADTNASFPNDLGIRMKSSRGLYICFASARDQAGNARYTAQLDFSSDAMAANTMAVKAIAIEADGTARLYGRKDGGPVKTLTDTSLTPYEFPVASIGAGPLIGGYDAVKEPGTYVVLALRFPRALSDGELKEIFANPWRVFKPRTLWQQVGVLDSSLSVTDVSASANIDALAISQAHALAVGGVESAASAGSLVISQGHELSVGDAVSNSSADAAAISQASSITLTIADANAGAVIDAPAITQIHPLISSDIQAQPDTEAPTITQRHVLAAAEAESTATADQLAMAQNHALAVAFAESSTATVSPAISQSHELSVSDAVSNSSADAVAISQASSITLAIDGLISPAESGAVSITQTHALVAADAQAAALLDSVAVDLVTVHDLAIDGLISPAESGAAAITQTHALVATDAQAAALLDSVAFAGLGLGEIHHPSLINVTPRTELRSI